jgi:hypothetical protein
MVKRIKRIHNLEESTLSTTQPIHGQLCDSESTIKFQQDLIKLIQMNNTKLDNIQSTIYDLKKIVQEDIYKFINDANENFIKINKILYNIDNNGRKVEQDMMPQFTLLFTCWDELDKTILEIDKKLENLENKKN